MDMVAASSGRYRAVGALGSRARSVIRSSALSGDRSLCWLRSPSSRGARASCGAGDWDGRTARLLNYISCFFACLHSRTPGSRDICRTSNLLWIPTGTRSQQWPTRPPSPPPLPPPCKRRRKRRLRSHRRLPPGGKGRWTPSPGVAQASCSQRRSLATWHCAPSSSASKQSRIGSCCRCLRCLAAHDLRNAWSVLI